MEVRVIVWGPKGEKLREGTSLSEAIGALPVLFAAEQSGEYRVGVQANGAGSSSGRYRIQLDELRTEDRDRLIAFDDYAKAEELTAQATAASQRQAIPLFEQAADAAYQLASWSSRQPRWITWLSFIATRAMATNRSIT